MKKFGWRRLVIALAFLLAVLVAGLFAVRTVRRAVYWDRHRDEAIRPWMSVRYVARSYRVPPSVLYRAINLTPVPRDRRPLREVAREQNRPVADLIAELRRAIEEYRSHSPPPHPEGGGPP